MEKVFGEIRVDTTDSMINGLLRRKSDSAVGYSRHFNQSEDFFLRLGQEFQVPSFSIHHDVNSLAPESTYQERLRGFLSRLQQLIPGVFEGLTYFFDPAEILRPGFYQIYRVSGVHYLYLLRLDLTFRPQSHVVIEKGTNDTTPVYRTSNLIVEAIVIPLREVRTGDETPAVAVVEQMISDTWIGETGRGYFIQGIWMDADLNKFFTKLVIPQGKRIYPYYPFTSKYRTICHHPIGISSSERREAIPRLHRFIDFLKPHVQDIQSILREQEFSPDLALFKDLKGQTPRDWNGWFDGITMDVYLNEQEMREFEVLPPEGRES